MKKTLLILSMLFLAQSLSGCGEAATGAVTAVSEAVSEAAPEASDKAESLVSEAASAASEAVQAARNEDGSFNPEGLKAYGRELYNAYASGESNDSGDMDALFRKVDNTNEAVKNYILDRNAGLLKPGEIQILTGGNVCSEEYADLKDFRLVYCAIQYNYKKDENSVLRYVDGRDDVIMFTLKEEDDGNITVTDARVAEKGEKEAVSLEEMCRELDCPYEDALELLEFDRAYDVDDLIDYMKKNPEITGIEYDGKVRTAEELEELKTERLKVLYPEDFK